MEPMLYLLGVLAAVVGVALSIGLHEIGHLVPAKRFGVKVTQYMVGFGPTLWSRRRGETEYGVKAIPLGGYVRMIGMYPPPDGAPEGAVGRGTTGRFELLSQEARAAAWEEVGPGDEQRVFYRLSVPRKVTVMLGGPVMNLVIAAFAFTVLLVGIGVPTPTTSIATVFPCVPPAMASEAAARAALDAPADADDEACPSDAPTSPAVQAGLVAGERIVSVNGQPVAEWEQLTDVTRAAPGATVVLGVADAQGTTRETQVELATAWRPVFDEDGLPTDEVVASGYLGVAPLSEYVSQPITSVPGTMWGISVRSAQALLSLPVRVAELAGDLVAGEERDPRSPVSVVGVGRLSGEVTAAEEPVKAKVATLLSLLAGLNLFLFLFNLVPLLPLDGGHVAGALWEGLRRRIAALRGQPDPGPVDVSKALPLAYAVGIALIALSSVVILADVINPISIYG
ncbi:MAG: site-2 protease family protein [Candidatus Nanopelagicales bacterium]|jgi:membrane-associated protease RseP (regulator of RpoE activity)|nr:site-2 protease family protein [Candidatus Nanopelagicales bacterium]